MPSLANVSLQNTFQEWVTRLNQVVVKGNDAEVYANSSFATANTANLSASFAAPRANLLYTTINVAHSYANTGQTWSQAAFARSNVAFNQANLAHNYANTAQTWSGAAYTQANTATTWASAAYGAANAAGSSASISAAFGQANQAFATANTKLTANTPSALGTFTTDSWNVPLKITQGHALQWVKSGTSHAYGFGVTGNTGFYMFNSTAEDASAGVNYFFRVSPNTFTYNTQTIWHAGNDGAGSGLDADTVDGVQASSFLLSANYTAADVLSKLLTVDGTGSGVDADILDGMQPDSNATADTIVRRNSAGQIFASHFASSDNSQTSGVNGIMVKAGDNYYLRTGTAAAVATFLSGQTMNISGSATTFTSTTQNSQFNSLGVGTAASGTAGEIRATNNITAYYSDFRLKNIEHTIDSPVDKVMQLSGVFYRNNEIAKKHGYNSNERQVGVIAQDVQKVLPEAVAPAPFDTTFDELGNMHSISGQDYLTVRMERLIPLLIEAIKEQELKIRDQQKLIDTLLREKGLN